MTFLLFCPSETLRGVERRRRDGAAGGRQPAGWIGWERAECSSIPASQRCSILEDSRESCTDQAVRGSELLGGRMYYVEI